MFASPVCSEPGRWDRAWTREDRSRAPGEVSPDALDDFQSLPYLQGYFPAPKISGVTRYDRRRTQTEYLLYCSGHRAQAGIMDIAGHVLHEWSFEIRELWPDAAGQPPGTFWRKVSLLPDGSLLAIYETIGLVKLDQASRLMWARRDGHHHTVQTDKSGTIYTLTRRSQTVPWLGLEFAVYDEFVQVLSPDGAALEEYSLLDAFRRSPFAGLVKNSLAGGNDILHTNSLQILDGRHAGTVPAFRKGNILMAFRNLNAIGILDPADRQIKWLLEGKETGLWDQAHHARLLPNGNLLVFDNQGGDSGHGRSRVVEFNPVDARIVWLYEGREGSPFDSPTCGTAQRLANGHTLITETDRGRTFIVTAEGDIIWEYVNPYRAGRDQELIATLLQVRSIPGIPARINLE